MAKVSICKIEGCGKPTGTRGWCHAHYRRWRLFGNPNRGGVIRTARGQPLEFLKDIASNPPEGCVDWPFAKNPNGYGNLNYSGRMTTAHRASWEIYHGRVMRKDRQAAHAPGFCHNPSCVNPLHVREATKKDNEDDKLQDGTRIVGSDHRNSKLTESDVRAIRADKRSHTEIAEDYPVARPTITMIINRKSWTWLD